MAQQTQPQIYPLIQQNEPGNVPMSQIQYTHTPQPITPAGNISSAGRYN